MKIISNILPFFGQWLPGVSHFYSIFKIRVTHSKIHTELPAGFSLKVCHL